MRKKKNAIRYTLSAKRYLTSAARNVLSSTIHYFLLILCFLLFFVISIGRVEAYPFKAGEKLTYTIKWSGTSPLVKVLVGESVGELVIEVKERLNPTNGEFGYLFSWELRILGAFFHEKRENLVNVDTLFPYRVTFSREGWSNPRKSWIIKIDQKTKLALINDEKNGEEEIRLSSSPVFDIPSLIYWLRVQKLEVEEEFSFFLLEDDSPEACKEKIGEQVQVKVLKKEKVAIHNKIYLTFLCEEVGSKKIKVWFSADEGHLPVKIEVDVGEGAFIAFLDKGKSIF